MEESVSEFEENETKTSIKSSITSEPSKLSPMWGATSRALCWFMDIGLFYWTVRLFKLKLNTTSLSVDSSVNFSFDEFQSFVNTSVVVAIVLATVTLLWIVVKNVVSSLMCENGIVWKIWSASQTIFWG